MIRVRACRDADMPAVLEIYAVHAGDPADRVTFEEVVPTLDDMRERRVKVCETLGLPYLVATATLETLEQSPRAAAAHGGAAAASEDETIVGYAYCSQFRSRAAYRRAAEVSIYVRQGCRGRGVGSTLLQTLIAKARECNLHSLISVMGTEEDNPGSYHLHTQNGFRVVGVLKEVGCKHGVLIDRLLMERLIGKD